MSDTFDHEMEAFEDGVNRCIFVLPQDVNDWERIRPVDEEREDDDKDW